MTKRVGVSAVVWSVAGVIVAALIYFELARRKEAREPNGSSTVEVASDAAVVPADAGIAPNVVDAAPLEAAIDAAIEAAIDAPVDAPPAVPLYTVTEALDDVLSGPLQFIGTGPWFGNASIHACAYRNERVIVVYEYCTVREQPALGLIVISPSRGVLKIYAEADSAISTLERTGYFTFRIEVQPPRDTDPISLEVAYADLNAWEERRYNAFAPSCWSGDGTGCSPGLDPQPWAESAESFLREPPAAWHALAKDLHARAVRDSRRK